jgi:hypothetical protein
MRDGEAVCNVMDVQMPQAARGCDAAVVGSGRQWQ